MRHRSSWLRPLLALSLAGTLGCAPNIQAPPITVDADQPAQPAAPAPVASPEATPAAPVIALRTLEGVATLAGKPMAGATIVVEDPVTEKPVPVGSAPEGKPYMLEPPALTTAEGHYTVKLAGLQPGRGVRIIARKDGRLVSDIVLGASGEGQAAYKLQAADARGRIDEVTTFRDHLVHQLLSAAEWLRPVAIAQSIENVWLDIERKRRTMGAALAMQPNALNILTSDAETFQARMTQNRAVADLMFDTELRVYVAKTMINHLTFLADIAKQPGTLLPGFEQLWDEVSKVRIPGTKLETSVDFQSWKVVVKHVETGKEVDVTENPEQIEKIEQVMAPPSSSSGGDSTPAPAPAPVLTLTDAQFAGFTARTFEELSVDAAQTQDTWGTGAAVVFDVTPDVGADNETHVGAHFDGARSRYLNYDATGKLFRDTDVYDDANPPLAGTPVTIQAGAGTPGHDFSFPAATLTMHFVDQAGGTHTLYFDVDGLVAMVSPHPVEAGKFLVVRATGL